MSVDLVPEEPNRRIPLHAPEFRGREWEYVRDCLDQAWVSSVGNYVTRFEQAVADAAGCRFGVATVNGTAALHLALRALGIGHGDVVILPSLTFIAPANAVRYTGATPVFVDVDNDTGQIAPASVLHFLQNDCTRQGTSVVHARTGGRVQALLPVHLLGLSADMGALIDIARAWRLKIIEDAAEGIGVLYRDRPVGGWGDVGCFSFNGNKLITTGGGGVLVTRHENIAARAAYLSTQAKDDPVEYVHNEVGYNYRLPNVLAAIGCAQMESLDSYIDIKRTLAERYRKGLSDLRGLTPPTEYEDTRSTYWLYALRVNPHDTGFGSRELIEHLEGLGIQARPLWQPLHRSPAHAPHGGPPCPIADAWWENTVCLPSSVGLSKEDQQTVIDAVRAFHAQQTP